MDIIDTFWEKKNLNKTTLEINFKPGDSISEVYSLLEVNKYDYIVVKVPIVEPTLLNGLQDVGFRFCESQVSLINNLNKSYDIESLSAKMGRKFQVSKVGDKQELQDILNSITNDMFFSDRIALDDKFGAKLSNRRYKYWIENEFGNQAIDILKITRRDKSIGFIMAYLKADETVQVLLGGVYSMYQGMGWGHSIVYKPIERYLSMGKKIMRTKVSSNNLGVLKLYISMGYQIENIEYILVRHREAMNANGG